MALTTQERNELKADIMREASRRLDVLPITKGEVLDVIIATDDFFDSIQSSYNSAIPPGPRAALNTAMKTYFFKRVLQKRTGEG